MESPLRTNATTQKWTAPPYEVTAAAVAAYARATRDERAAYADEAPLLFAVVYTFAAALAPLFDGRASAEGQHAELLRRLVRGELDVMAHRPIRVGERLTTVGQVTSVEAKGANELFTLESETRDAEGVLVAVVRNLNILRGARPAAAAPKGANGHSDAAPPARGDEAFAVRTTVDAGQPAEYAAASLDDSPIHVDDDFARAAGLPGVILQGSCTLALAARAIVDACCGGEPSRLRRIKARFAQIVRPGDELTTRGWPTRDHAGMAQAIFEMRNQADVPVLTLGLAEYER